MFDVGFSELLLIGVVALLVLGPERLPRAARTVGGFMRKARNSWLGLRAEIEREIEAGELRKRLREVPTPQGLMEELRAPLSEAEQSLQESLRESERSMRDALQPPAAEVAEPAPAIEAPPPPAPGRIPGA